MVTSGYHLRAVRNWMQWNAKNGETVIWGSDDEINLTHPLTVSKLETLAQQVREGVLAEVREAHPGVCTKFIPDYQGDFMNKCGKCKHTRRLHDLLNNVASVPKDNTEETNHDAMSQE